VAKAVRNHLDKYNADKYQGPTTDRELIEQNVQRIIVKPHAIEIHLISEPGQGSDEHDQDSATQRPTKCDPVVVITVPRATTAKEAVKGFLHSLLPSSTMSVNERDVLLTAIAKARAWIDDIVEGRATSFAEISKHEGKVERHVRLLAPLAFVSPGDIANIIDGVAPSVSVTDLAKRVAYCWTRKETHLRPGP
jgi:hypothetical protein